MYFYWQKGYDIYGVDAVEENIAEARRLHPEIAARVSVADLRKPLGFPEAHFDFLTCNAVIQHIDPETTLGVTLPEFTRVLGNGGVLQLMFKTGAGVATVYDKDYGADRTFQLYGVDEVVGILADRGLSVVAPEGDKLGGVIHFKDPKPMDHCVLFARKIRLSKAISELVKLNLVGQGIPVGEPFGGRSVSEEAVSDSGKRLTSLRPARVGGSTIP